MVRTFTIFSSRFFLTFNKFPGRVKFNPAAYESVLDDAFIRQSVNFWQEFLFLSDHGEIPKVIQLTNCQIITLGCLQNKFKKMYAPFYLNFYDLKCFIGGAFWV